MTIEPASGARTSDRASTADDAGAPASQRSPFEVLRERDFAIYWTTATISSAGSFMQSVGTPFVLFALTHRHAWVGAGAFASTIPALLMSPLAGTASDRFDRRIVLVWANVVQLLSAAALWIFSATGQLTPWLVLGLLALGGVGGGFQFTASQAMVSTLTSRENLVAAVRLHSMSFTVARAVGPALAGGVLALWGATTTFALNTLSFVVVLAGLAMVRVRPVRRLERGDPWPRQFADGLRYILARPSLRLTMATGFVVALFGQSVAQLAAGLADEYQVGGGGLGILTAMIGVGSFLSGASILTSGDRRRRSRTACTGVFLYASGAIIAGATSVFGVGLAGFFCMGLAHVLVSMSLNTSTQMKVDEDYRGRVLSTYLSLLLFGLPIGSLIGGRLGDLYGLRPTVIGMGALLLVWLIVLIVRFDALTVIDRDEPDEPQRRQRSIRREQRATS